MRPDQPTQTQATQSFYLRIVARLDRHATRLVEAGEMAVIDDKNVRIAIAYRDLEPTITAASARLYRAAVRHAITHEPGSRDWDAEALIDPEPCAAESARLDDLAQQRKVNLVTLRGAQQKAKWLPMAEWARLNTALGATHNPWARAAQQWIVATLIVGLRPCEWRRAKVVGTSLVVVNAKATNGRAHSETRTIGLARCVKEDRAMVASFAEWVSQLDDPGYKAAYDGVRDLIRVTARTTFPGRDRHPSLYTARHSFAARAKATHSREGVAALMGHASTLTAGRNYAHSRHARGGRPLDAEPSPADIAAVLRARDANRLLPGLKDTP